MWIVNPSRDQLRKLPVKHKYLRADHLGPIDNPTGRPKKAVSELRSKIRHLPANDQAELLRFADYLKDKKRMAPAEFHAKWKAYEDGTIVKQSISN